MLSTLPRSNCIVGGWWFSRFSMRRMPPFYLLKTHTIDVHLLLHILERQMPIENSQHDWHSICRYCCCLRPSHLKRWRRRARPAGTPLWVLTGLARTITSTSSTKTEMRLKIPSLISNRYWQCPREMMVAGERTQHTTNSPVDKDSATWLIQFDFISNSHWMVFTSDRILKNHTLSCVIF